MSIYKDFCSKVNALDNPHVVEVGTLRWGANSTHHKADFTTNNFVMADMALGPDVDEVIDLHNTSIENRFDAFIACSVWEHLHSPWIAAENVIKMLKSGGYFFIQTHHTFPVHAYPTDMFRYTTEGLAWLFKRVDAEVLESAYTFPCQIVPPASVKVWSKEAPCFLNVNIFGKKRG